MNTHRLSQYILPILHKQQDQGLTIFDLLFEIVLLGSLAITVPSLLKSSAACSSVGCNSGASLVLRMRY